MTTFSMRRIAPVRNGCKARSDMGCANRAGRLRVKQADLRQGRSGPPVGTSTCLLFCPCQSPILDSCRPSGPSGVVECLS